MDLSWDGISQTVSMSYKGKKIQAMVGSNIVIVGGNRVALSAPLSRQHGAVIVPPDFESLIVGPAAKPQEDYMKGLGMEILRKVVVDAGHGGKDPGAIGYGGLQEKDVNLDIARRVKKNFEAAGIQVVMTRDSDEFISLADRTVVATQPGVDLFVSIHSNSNKSRRSHGVEVYYAGDLSLDDKDDDQRRENEKKMASLLQMRSDIPDLRGIVCSMLYCRKLGLSPGLADEVARRLSHEAGGEARGSKPERYYVLRNTLIPAILVEVGFITNPRESGLLKDGDYRQKIADSITKSVLRYVYASGS